MRSELNSLIEKAKKEEKYFRNYLYYGRLIKKAAEEILGKVKVFVFGSILKKDEVARDIDILIISPKLENATKKSQARVKLFQKLGFFSPFEIHLITPEEYNQWYKFFIKKKIRI